MEIGIDSFAAASLEGGVSSPEKNVQSLEQLLERIAYADQVGLDYFGIGEHHRKEFLDAATAVILAAAAAKTTRIKLGSAVTVLSAVDPVRAFQQFATLDLISKGRAELVVGRGSFTDAFPLFGFKLHDYDELFAEKLELFLQINENIKVDWKGRFRAPLVDQEIYPRPIQPKLPVWLGVGGTPQSFVRAGQLGLPLMIAVIGGETHRFRPLVDLYKESGLRAGYNESDLQVGLHSLGYVAENKEKAVADYFPGYAETFTRIGKERGWPPVTKQRFDAQNGHLGALLVGGPEEVAEKIIRHSEALGGISRFTFQMDNAALPHEKLMNSIRLIGEKIKPIIQNH